jgi:hypothetical protein
MGYWRTLHLFDDKKFYKEVVPKFKGKTGDLTNDCLEFLKSHVTGGLNHLSEQQIINLVNQTIENIISISKTFDEIFKTNFDYQKIENYDTQRHFLNKLEGHYEFCKFFENYIFKTCADFLPHLPLGKGGVSRNFDMKIKTLSYALVTDLDDWNEFLTCDGGITNWITHEDIEYLYLDKENLRFEDNPIAEGFLSLLEIAHDNRLGLIMGVDMREDKLARLQSYKLVPKEKWDLASKEGLIVKW